MSVSSADYYHETADCQAREPRQYPGSHVISATPRPQGIQTIAQTEAELRTMEQNLDELGRQVATARIGFNKEKQEADAIQRLADQRLAAANQMQAELEQTSFNLPRKAELEHSLSLLLSLLEEMAPDVDREKQDATEAAEFLQSLESTYESAANKLRSARSELDRAHRDMGRAEQQKEIAERRAEASRQAAGLSGATSGLSVALKAMQDVAQRNLVEAEAANQKARLLQPTSPERDDPNIAKAMHAVRGEIGSDGSRRLRVHPNDRGDQ